MYVQGKRNKWNNQDDLSDHINKNKPLCKWSENNHQSSNYTAQHRQAYANTQIFVGSFVELFQIILNICMWKQLAVSHNALFRIVTHCQNYYNRNGD